MEYIQVLDNITTLLNKKNYGRGKKGLNVREEFKGYLLTLKDDFKKEISTEFLFNLMSQNTDRTNRQKRQKIHNLTRDLNKEKRGYYIRGLEVLNYKSEIAEYGFKKGYNPEEMHKNREGKTKIQITKKGFPYVKLCKGEELREIGKFIKEDKGISLIIGLGNLGKRL